MVTLAQSNFENVDVNDFQQIIASDSVQLIDVRTPEEYAEGHLKGSMNIDMMDSTFKVKALELLDKHRPVAIYCRSGKRSAMSASLLAKEGFKTINLLGGILAWEEEAKEVVKEQEGVSSSQGYEGEEA